MNYEALFKPYEGRVVRVGLVGAGDFGTSFLAQVQCISNLEIVVVCDTNLAQIDAAIASAGVERNAIAAVTSMKDATDVEFDVMVEGTGSPIAATENAVLAISRGQHVVLVSKEGAILVGPILYRMAQEKGLVYTEVDGDQPSLLIGLMSWAKMLGLEIRAAGKASEYDYVLEDDDTLSWQGQKFPNIGLQDLWVPDGLSWSELIEQRNQAVLKAGVPTKTVPDYCEMGVVMNATGFKPDLPALHAPILRTTELADAFQLVVEGGFMLGKGRIDVFNCLRRPDEASFAGGVFIIVSCEDENTWELLRGKGHVVALNTKTAMLYNPQHLLGIEAPITILCAALLGLPTGAVDPYPHVDLVARTSQDFKKGDVLAITNAHHHEVDGLSPELMPAIAIGEGKPCPYYLAVGQQLVEDVAAGTVLIGSMLALDRSSLLYQLRETQDDVFGIK